MKTRHTKVIRQDHFDNEDIHQALCEEGAEEGFRLISSGAEPSQATRFQVYLVGERLHVAVLAFGSRSHTEEESIELLLDPLCDGIGHLQFGACSSGTVYETSHWPYRDPQFMGMGMPDWSVTVEREENGEDILWFYLFSVDVSEFSFGESIGLNVARSLHHSGESSTWNLVSGIGFADAGCFGRLWMTKLPMSEPEKEQLVEESGSIMLQGTYDWPDNVGNVAYTWDDLRREMAWYKDLGLERVYWIDYLNYDVWADRAEGRWGENIKKTLESFGDSDFLPGAIKAAHEAGLEFFTIFKPFDLYPEESFPAANPDLTIRRNPAWMASPVQPMEKICLYVADDRPWPFAPDTLELWVSNDNYSYRRYEEELKITETVVERADSVWTPRGQREGSNKRRVRSVEISGLAQMDASFFALHWEGQQASWRNRLYRMIELKGADGSCLPVRIDLRDTLPEGGFDLAGRSANAPSWGRSDTGMDRLVRFDGSEGAIGLTRCLDEYLPSMLDPMFAKVQEYFLQRLRRGIDAGADGVSLRIANHVGCDDWLSYMFAEPVLDTFRNHMGREPEVSNEDLSLIRCLRGEAYTGFLRRASKMAREAGKTFTHHLENRMLVPARYDNYMQIHWDWEGWIREGLFDEVDLKYIGPDHRDCRESILPLCRKHGVKINWINSDPEPRWKSRSMEEAPLLIDRAHAGGVDGINLYELWLYRRMTERGTPMTRGCGEAIIRGMSQRIQSL